MARRLPALLTGLAVLAGACSRSGRDPTPQAGGPDPGPAVVVATTVAPSSAAGAAPSLVTSTAVPPRPPAPPATAILRAAVAVEPAARLPLTPGAEVVVHPEATFEVELSARVADARLALVDARDDLVPASATRELGAGTKLTLAPAAPLVPASRYVLRLDGVSDRDLHDDAGRAFAAVTLPLLAAGAPPPPEPKKAAKKRRRH
jgi:hypothetical protein